MAEFCWPNGWRKKLPTACHTAQQYGTWQYVLNSSGIKKSSRTDEKCCTHFFQHPPFEKNTKKTWNIWCKKRSLKTKLEQKLYDTKIGGHTSVSQTKLPTCVFYAVMASVFLVSQSASLLSTRFFIRLFFSCVSLEEKLLSPRLWGKITNNKSRC